MSMYRARVTQLVAVLVAVALATLAVPGSPLRPASADAAGCNKIRDRAVSIAATEKTTTRWVKIDQSGNVSYTEWKTLRGPVNLGTMRLTLELCKSGGSWDIRKVQIAQPHNDLTLTVTGGRVTKITPADHGDNGYAIIYRHATNSSVRVEAHRCTAAPRKFTEAARKTLHGVASLPLPGPYWVSAGLWAADVALPDAPEKKFYCGRMGPVVDIDLKLNNGAPHLVWGTPAHVLRVVRDSWEQPCGGEAYRYCAEMVDQTVVLKKP